MDKMNLSPIDEPQLLTESGPILLRDFNPKGVLRFMGRKCVTCGAEIMDHWLRPSDDADKKGLYWCTQEGPHYSEGIQGTVWDVPKDFADKHLVEKSPQSDCSDKKWDE